MIRFTIVVVVRGFCPEAPYKLIDRLVRSVGVLGPFELNFESLHSNLEAIHRLNGRLSTGRIVETDKTYDDCIRYACHTLK